MRFRFNERKAAQAAAHLLKRRGGRMHHLKLIKLLYLADRHVLAEQGRLITGDRLVSMDRGPVLSRVLDLITEDQQTAGAWREYVSPPSEFQVGLIQSNPEADELSQYELRVLDATFDEFGYMNRWDLVGLTHDLPEWVNPNGSPVPIEPETILREEGWDPAAVRNAAHDAEDTYLIDLRAGVS
jgi:uncharacterized phage-associated protein